MNYIGKKIKANYFRGPEAVGGWICFDETGLLFKSHGFNIQIGETRIDYNQIRDVSTYNLLGFIPTGLMIIDKDGVNHKFLIYHRKLVMEFLRQQITSNN